MLEHDLPHADTESTSEADRAMRVWREYAGGIAWPTVMLTCGVTMAWSAAVTMHAVGLLSTPAAAVLSFLACYVALTPAHEAAHGNVSGKAHRWLDSIVGWISMFILLGPFPPFRELHLRHHAHTNHPTNDPDMWVAASGPALLLRFATILPRYYWSYCYPPANVDSQLARTRYYAIGFFLGYVALMAGMAWAGLAMTAIWVMIIPAWLALSVLAVVFDWLPHHPHLHRERFLNTRAIPSVVLEVLLLGQNVHLVHHLWPAVPWYCYGTVFRRTETELRDRGAFVVKSAKDLVVHHERQEKQVQP